MSESDILSIIRSCGLAPGKARNIRKLAQTIAAEHGGRVPNDIQALEKLPGVGHKNRERGGVAGIRHAGIPVDRTSIGWLGDGIVVRKKCRTDRARSEEAVPARGMGEAPFADIYFGREYCPARNHDFDKCPICSWAAPSRGAVSNDRRCILQSTDKSVCATPALLHQDRSKYGRINVHRHSCLCW